MYPHIKILILNWNGEDIIEKCIDSIKLNNYKNYSIDIIDNGSKDKSISILTNKYPEITLHKISKNLGYSRGYNYAFEKLKISTFDYYLILNNDVIVKNNLLIKLYENIIKYGENNIYCPKIYNLNNNKIWYAGGYYNRFLGITKHIGIDKTEDKYTYKTRKTGYASGCCLLIKKNIIEKLKGFDSSYFMYYEDVDLCLRAKKLSCDIYYLDDCSINHEISFSIGSNSLVKILNKVRSQIKFIYKINTFLIFLLSFIINFVLIPVYFSKIIINKIFKSL